MVCVRGKWLPALEPDDPRHGTANGYNNRGCRCAPCRAAWNKKHGPYVVAWSHRVGKHKPWEQHLAEIEPEHGTETRYTSQRYKCRCDLCRAAAKEARRRRRWENIEHTRAYDRERKRRERDVS